jgi:hypothetical protein
MGKIEIGCHPKYRKRGDENHYHGNGNFDRFFRTN